MEESLYDIEISRWLDRVEFDEFCEFGFLNGSRIPLNGSRSKLADIRRDYLPGYVQEMILSPNMIQMQSWMEKSYEIYVSVELWRNEWWKGEVPAFWTYRVFKRSSGWREITLPDTVLYSTSVDCLKASLKEAIYYIDNYAL
jgi:hypothetical protein